MNICLTSMRDKRRIESSVHFQSCTVSSSQIVEKSAQTDHSVKGRAQLPAYCCKTNVNNHKKVRLGDNNQFNDSNDDDRGGNNGGGVGLCCSSFEIRGLTSVLKSNTTTTMNSHTDDDNDDDTETARRATPSSSIANPDLPGEGSSRLDVHRALTPSSNKQDSWSSIAPPVTCRRSRIPSPAGTGSSAPNNDEFKHAHTSLDLTAHQQTITAQVPVPTCTWPIHKSTDNVVTTCVTSIDVDPACVSTPAPAGNSRETEIGTNLHKILPIADAELCRFSKTTETELCRFSKNVVGCRVAIPAIANQ